MNFHFRNIKYHTTQVVKECAGWLSMIYLTSPILGFTVGCVCGTYKAMSERKAFYDIITQTFEEGSLRGGACLAAPLLIPLSIYHRYSDRRKNDINC
jgi:hypothetical protein